MNLIRHAITVITMLPVTGFSTRAQVTNQTNADALWKKLSAPIWGISSKDSADRAWNSSSAKYMAWDELRKMQYREKGIEFFEKNPHDKRFTEWFLRASAEYRPGYWKNPMEQAKIYESYLANGSPLVLDINESARTAWGLRSLHYRTIYLSDSAVPEADKIEFRKRELGREIYYQTGALGASTGDLGAKLKQAMPLFLQYAATATDLGIVEQLQDIASHDPEFDRVILSNRKASADSNVRSEALAYESLQLRLREKPVGVKLPALDDKTVIDLGKLRGKVLMVDFWNLHCGSCFAHMPKFERLYKKYRDKGFVLVSIFIVAGNDTGDRKKQVEKAGVIERKYGLTYPSAKIMLVEKKDPATGEMLLDDEEPTWKYFGWPAPGSIFLFDKAGHLITTDQSGQWMEYEIRKALDLSLDDTGK